MVEFIILIWFNKQLNNQKIKMCFSSKEAFDLTEEEYLAFINKKIYVEILTFNFGKASREKAFVLLEEFMEEFRPEMYEKYKLLLDK